MGSGFEPTGPSADVMTKKHIVEKVVAQENGARGLVERVTPSGRSKTGCDTHGMRKIVSGGSAFAMLALVGLTVTTCLVLASDRSKPPAAMAQENDPPPSFDRAFYEKMWLEKYQSSDPTEPRLPVFDEAKAREFLDTTSLNWAGRNGCGTCHTNIPYLMVRPLMSRSVACHQRRTDNWCGERGGA
jgi:hypothetical protein